MYYVYTTENYSTISQSSVENQKNFPKNQIRTEVAIRNLGVELLVLFLSMISGYTKTKDPVT